MMARLYCPKHCRMVQGSTWFKGNDFIKNKLKCSCGCILDEGYKIKLKIRYFLYNGQEIIRPKNYKKWVLKS